MSRGQRVLFTVTPVNLARRYQQAERRQRKRIVRQLNKLARERRKHTINLIHQEFTLNKAYIRDRVLVREATIFNMEAAVQGKGRKGANGHRTGLLLNRFKHRQLTKKGRPAGISVQIRRGEKPTRLRGAWYQRLKNGDREGGRLGIAIRPLGSLNRGFTGKDKILIGHGPSIPGMINVRRDEIVGDDVRERLKITLREDVLKLYSDGFVGAEAEESF